MVKKIIPYLLLIAFISTSNESLLKKNYCEHLGVNFYEVMGMESILKYPGGCPIAYKWPDFEDQCFINGKKYKGGEKFPVELHNFRADCQCHMKKNRSSITCGVFSINITNEITDKVPCGSSGKYYSGDTYDIKATCLTCICNMDYDGKRVQPNCFRIGQDIRYSYYKQIRSKCAPIYDRLTKDKPLPCLPSTFLCDEDIINIKVVKEFKLDKNFQEELLCQMDGDLYPKNTVLNVTVTTGDLFTSNSFLCTCTLPPLFNCMNIYI